MLKQILLVTLFCATGLAESSGFKQVIGDDSILISLENGNYALASTELKQFNWASVSINGDRARTYSADCETSERNIDDLGTDERRLVKSIVRRLRDANLPGGPKFPGGQMLIKDALLFMSEIRSFHQNDLSLHRIGAEHFALRSNLLAEEKLKWAISDADNLLTFIDDDDNIQMIPSKCVGTGTIRLVEDSKREVERAEVAWESDPKRQLEDPEAKQAAAERRGDILPRASSYSCKPISEPIDINNLGQIEATPSDDNKALVKFAGYLTFKSKTNPKNINYMALNLLKVRYSKHGDQLRIVNLETDCAEIEMRVNKYLKEYQINQIAVNIEPTEGKQPECQMELDWKFLDNTYWNCDKLQIWTHCSDYTNTTNPYNAQIGLHLLKLDLELEGIPSECSQGHFSKYPRRC